MNRSVTRSSMRLLLWGVALAVVVALSFGVLVLLFGRLPNEDERGLVVLAVIPELEFEAVGVEEVRDGFHFLGERGALRRIG